MQELPVSSCVVSGVQTLVVEFEVVSKVVVESLVGFVMGNEGDEVVVLRI